MEVIACGQLPIYKLAGTTKFNKRRKETKSQTK